MTPNEFVYWLKGAIELSMKDAPTPEQWEIIKDHLKLVLTKVTPDRTNSEPKPRLKPNVVEPVMMPPLAQPLPIGNPPFEQTPTTGTPSALDQMRAWFTIAYRPNQKSTLTC